MSAALDIEESAARWLLRREEPAWSSDDQAALDAWLEASMAHKAAFWRLEHGWREADRIAALGSVPDLATAATWQGWTNWWWPAAIAASLLLAVSLILVQILPGGFGSDPPAETAARSYATQVGGRKTLSLPDGSRVELNTATVVRAAMSQERREFWLVRGEAYFEVARAEDRPFIVHAGPRTITVLGTRFSIRRDRDRVIVAVLEGRVRIDQAGEVAPGRSATITGGDVAIAEGPSTLVAANDAERVESRLSWRSGVLTFDQSTLAEAAAEFNRYNRRQVIISDPDVAQIRIGGTFRAANVDAFVRLLRDAYGLRVEVRDEEVTISG